MNRACGKVHNALGSNMAKPITCSTAVMASGSMVLVARLSSGADVPDRAEPAIATSAATTSSGVGRIGPSCTTSATPVKPAMQPNSLERVSVSSRSHAEAKVPNMTEVTLSTAL